MHSDPAAVTSLLAVYGTLRRGYRNHHLIASGSRYLGLGEMPGRLVHVASPLRRYPYPAYLPHADDPALRVVVEVVEIVDAALWPALDALERYLPDDPPGSEYLRATAVAGLADGGSVTCWTYVYNAPVDGYGVVPDGDWSRVAPADVTTP